MMIIFLCLIFIQVFSDLFNKWHDVYSVTTQGTGIQLPVYNGTMFNYYNHPGSRNTYAYAQLPQSFFIFGGEVDSENKADLFEIDLSTKKWRYLGGHVQNSFGNFFEPPYFPARQGSCMAATDGKLYIFGGNGKADNDYGEIGNLNDLWEFNLGSKEFSFKIEVDSQKDADNIGSFGTGMEWYPGSRRLSGMAIYDDEVYIFGGVGCDQNNCVEDSLGDLWAWDPITENWRFIQTGSDTQKDGHPLSNYGTTFNKAYYPGGRHSFMHYVYQTSWFIFGGNHMGAELVKGDLWEYSFTGVTWRWRNTFVDDNSTQTATVGIYGTTFNKAYYPSARKGGIMTSFGTSLHLFGGEGYGSVGVFIGDLADFWEYSIPLNTWRFFENDVGQRIMYASSSYTSTFDGTKFPNARTYSGGFAYNSSFFIYAGTDVNNLLDYKDLWEAKEFLQCGIFWEFDDNVCNRVGDCVNGICQCTVDGYLGSYCEFCSTSDYCNEKANNCINYNATNNCSCYDNFFGDSCEFCTDVECNKQSDNCTNDQGTIECGCKSGFSGEQCESCDVGIYCNSNANPENCYNNANIISCICEEGYDGSDCWNCSVDVFCNEQAHNCTGYNGNLKCSCKDGYNGTNCEECDVQQFCNNQANGCTNSDGINNCRCKDYYVGDSCQECNVNEFCNHKAHNCTNEDAENTCNCIDGFTGNDCEECDIDIFCNKKADNCTNNAGNNYCGCQIGYNGEFCQDCSISMFCNSQANTCVNSEGTNTCNCKTHFDGNSCEECSVSEFCNSQAHNCTNDGVTNECVCKLGYTGILCETCNSDTFCNSKSDNCTNIEGSNYCGCKTGYSGSECETCSVNMYCNARADNCTNVKGNNICGCQSGYFGDKCQFCSVNEFCNSKADNCTNSAGTNKCGCSKGYNGNSCNLCSTSMFCNHQGTNCTNNAGNFQCGCVDGYDGESCADCNVDMFCNKKADTCLNTAGVNFCDCVDDYSGEKCELCSVDKFCNSRAKNCTNSDGSKTCNCKPNYSGNDCQICDFTKLCNNQGTSCINFEGINNCQCKNGYSGNNCGSCDVEMFCHSKASACANVVGNRTCYCIDGYGGDSCTIIISVDDYTGSQFDMFEFKIGSKFTYQVSVDALPGVYSNMSTPSSRQEANGWRINNDEYLLFGGFGTEAPNTYYLTNDVWIYHLKWNAWKKVDKLQGGNKLENVEGNNLMEYNPLNYPSARRLFLTGDVSETEGVLIAGYGMPNGYLSDIWFLDYASHDFMKVRNSDGIFHVVEREEYDPSNEIGLRNDMRGVVFGQEFVTFGGHGTTQSGCSHLSLNGLWILHLVSIQWKLMSGEYHCTDGDPSYINTTGYHPQNIPSSRFGHVCWKIDDEIMACYGGHGKCKIGSIYISEGYLSDVWVYNVTSNMWAFKSGTLNCNTEPRYGTVNRFDSGVTIGGRSEMAGVKISNKEMLFFGGYGKGIKYYSDIFVYNFVNDKWKFFGGFSTPGEVSVYTGTQFPGGRKDVIAVKNDNGFFLVTGYGLATLKDKYGTLNDGWFGNYGFIFCGEIPSDHPDVCHGHGTCKSNGECECLYGWGGNYCDTYKCYDKLSSDDDVCGRNGYCYEIDHCLCFQEVEGKFGGDECDKKICHEKFEDDGNVCGGRGSCEDDHTCACVDSLGLECEIPLCSGISADNETVCNGNGNCLFPVDDGEIESSYCECFVNFEGEFCETFTYKVVTPAFTASGIFLGGTIMAVIVILFVILVFGLFIFLKKKIDEANEKIIKKKKIQQDKLQEDDRT